MHITLNPDDLHEVLTEHLKEMGYAVLLEEGEPAFSWEDGDEAPLHSPSVTIAVRHTQGADDGD